MQTTSLAASSVANDLSAYITRVAVLILSVLVFIDLETDVDILVYIDSSVKEADAVCRLAGLFSIKTLLHSGPYNYVF